MEIKCNDKEIQHIQIAAFYLIFLPVNISSTFQFSHVFKFILRLCLWP